MVTNEENSKTPDLNPVFSLSNINDSEISNVDFQEKVIKILKDILISSFPGNSLKQEIHPKDGRFNFACPYCGDSHTDPWKKRGNIYFKGFGYHCYNCSKHTSFSEVAKDFDVKLNLSELKFLKNSEETFKYTGTYASIDSYELMDFSRIEKYLIPRKEFMSKMGFAEANTPWIQKYLRSRLQFDDKKFAWNKNASKLLIMNLTKDKEFVIGAQIRNFKASPKYLTFKLDRIYSEILGKDVPETDDFDFANTISTIFGIFNLDINKPIMAFEGPLDSFLVNNGVGICSSKNQWPFDFPVNWLYDQDKEGKKQSMNRLSKGENVFLWRKFLEEESIKLNRSKKIDLTDIYTYCRDNNKGYPKLQKYFSNNKYDIYWL